MATSWRFLAEHRVDGVLVNAVSASVYVQRISDSADVYGSAASRIALPNTAAGVYLLESPAVFGAGVAYRAFYRITRAGGQTIDWTDEFTPSATAGNTDNWQYKDWRRQSGYAAQRDRLILHMEEVSERITANLSGGGMFRQSDVLRLYLADLQRELDRLDRMVGGGPKAGGFSVHRVL